MPAPHPIVQRLIDRSEISDLYRYAEIQADKIRLTEFPGWNDNPIARDMALVANFAGILELMTKGE
jgi:hypothetical protein